MDTLERNGGLEETQGLRSVKVTYRESMTVPRAIVSWSIAADHWTEEPRKWPFIWLVCYPLENLR